MAREVTDTAKSTTPPTNGHAEGSGVGEEDKPKQEVNAEAEKVGGFPPPTQPQPAPSALKQNSSGQLSLPFLA